MKKEAIKAYLEKVYDVPITDVKIKKLGQGVLGTGFALDFKVNGKVERKVLKTMFTQHLGKDYPADRAQSLILAHSNYNSMKKHVKSKDVCGVTDKEIIPLGKAKEFFILMDEAKGTPYFEDLEQYADKKELSSTDKEKIMAMSNYLIQLHKKKHKNPILYKRKIRDTIGLGEGMMGVLDMYPEVSFATKDDFKKIVQKSVEHWASPKVNRLCEVHGDYHPGNVWWGAKDFTLLDRARGKYGEAADDITAMTINHIFYSVKNHGKFMGAYEQAFKLFMDNYFKKTKDKEMMKVIQPYFAFRAVVVANPMFYNDKFYGSKTKANAIRRKMIKFASNVLNDKEFNPNEINTYLNK